MARRAARVPGRGVPSASTPAITAARTWLRPFASSPVAPLAQVVQIARRRPPRPGPGSKRGRRLEAAVVDGRDDRRLAGREPEQRHEAPRAARSITPGRSLPVNTSGCSIEPVAAMCALRADLVQRVARPHRDDPVEVPSATPGAMISTPAAAARAASARARSCPPSDSRCPPGSGPSSTSTTSAPSSAAVTAAARPAGPPPTTSTSAWRRRYSVRHSRCGLGLPSRPRPAAPRSTFS